MSAGASQTAEVSPYAAILAHSELELQLAGRGELTELAALGERWEELVAGLPARPPAAAAHLLAKARLVHERTRIELLRLREGMLSDLASTAQGKRTAAGYAGAGGPAGHSALDRTA